MSPHGLPVRRVVLVVLVEERGEERRRGVLRQAGLRPRDQRRPPRAEPRPWCPRGGRRHRRRSGRRTILRPGRDVWDDAAVEAGPCWFSDRRRRSATSDTTSGRSMVDVRRRRLLHARTTPRRSPTIQLKPAREADPAEPGSLRLSPLPHHNCSHYVVRAKGPHVEDDGGPCPLGKVYRCNRTSHPEAPRALLYQYPTSKRSPAHKSRGSRRRRTGLSQ
jgi:hypothetical protein